MQTLTTTEVARSIGQVAIDVQREPVTITQGRSRKPVAVIVAFDDFNGQRATVLPGFTQIDRVELADLRDRSACAGYFGQTIERCPGGRPICAGLICPHCDHDTGDGECPEPRAER